MKILRRGWPGTLRICIRVLFMLAVEGWEEVPIARFGNMHETTDLSS